MRIRVLVLVVLACLAAAPPAHAQMKQFRDWIAACDNTRRCTAHGIVSIWSHGYLKITRDGAPEAKPVVTLAVYVGDKKNFTLSFDRPVAGSFLPSGTFGPDRIEDDEHTRFVLEVSDQDLVAAFRKAKRIIITPTHEPEMWSHATLEGAIDALAWIDRQQKRAGTVTAMVARGAKQASTIPAPPAAPTIAAAKFDPSPVPPGFPPIVVDKGHAICGKAGRDAESGSEPREVRRLGPDLLLYWFFCPSDGGVYNHSNPLLLVPEGDPGRARVAALKNPPLVAQARKRRNEPPINVGFDRATMTLSVFHQGRSAGDCGDVSEWVWDGKEFRLAHFSRMPVCAGVAISDWPILYRATPMRN
jgi:Protein of unknown function (DUF1176)